MSIIHDKRVQITPIENSMDISLGVCGEQFADEVLTFLSILPSSLLWFLR